MYQKDLGIHVTIRPRSPYMYLKDLDLHVSIGFMSTCNNKT